MDAEHLEFDEFQVECSLRSIEGAPLDRLTKLKEILLIEETHPVLRPNVPHESAKLNPKGELQNLKIKLNYIYSLIKTAYSGTFDENPLSRLSSRLIHLNNRLKRIRFINAIISGDVEDLLNTTSKMLDIHDKTVQKQIDLNTSLGELGQITIPEGDGGSDISSISCRNDQLEESKSNNRPSKSAMLSQAQKLEEELMLFNTHNIQEVNFDQPHRSNELLSRSKNTKQDNPNVLSTQINQSEGKSGYLQRNVAKWNISFDGSPKGPPVKRFMFKLEHLAEANKLPFEQLVNDISYVLKGIAHEWYWIYIERNRGVNWSRLREDIIKRFQDRQTDDDLRHILDSRKQRFREPFQEFYSEMLSLSLQFEIPISDTQLMYTIRRNMRAGLQDKLVDRHFPTLEQMVQLCVTFEDTWARTGFVPEMMCQRRQVNELNTSSEQNGDSLYLGDYDEEICAFNADQRNYRPVTNLFTNRKPTAKANDGCWNCYQADHMFKNCIVPLKHKFCFGCGTPGIFKPYCTICKRNSGNANKGAGISCTWPPKVTARTEQQKPLTMTPRDQASNTNDMNASGP